MVVTPGKCISGLELDESFCDGHAISKGKLQTDLSSSSQLFSIVYQIIIEKFSQLFLANNYLNWQSNKNN